MLSKSLFIGVFTMLSFFTASSFADDWNLKKSEDGIEAYTKSVEGHSNLAFKGVVTMKGTVEQLVATHRDVSTMSSWLYTCYEPTVIKEIGPDSRLIYMKNRTPIVIKDRDLVIMQTVKTESPDHVAILLQGMPDAVEKKSGFVRIKYFNGGWDFRQIDNDHVQVEYFGEIDPSGAIPAFVSNLMVIDTPYESLKKLRAFINKKYTYASK